MAKYTEDVRQLLELIGGKENIQAVSHCMTRMRFVLVDEKKADARAIEKDQIRKKGHLPRRDSTRSLLETMWRSSIMNLQLMRGLKV